MNVLKIVEQLLNTYKPVFNYTPLQWMEIFVAANAGQEDLNWDEKIQWTRSHTLNELKSKELFNNSPAYFNAVSSLEELVRYKRSSYIGRLDASGMGATSTSTITNDWHGMELGNLIMDPSNNKKLEMYPIIYKEYHANIGSGLYTNVPYEFMTKKVIKEVEPNNPMGYKDLKVACYTALYDSTKVPYDLFGDNVKAFNKALYFHLEGGMLLRDRLSSTTDLTVPYYEFLAPDGFLVNAALWKTVQKRIESPLTHLQGNRTGSVTLQYDVQGIPEWDKSRAARMAHMVDAFILRIYHIVMNRLGAPTQATHDEYGSILVFMNSVPFAVAIAMATLSIYYTYANKLPMGGKFEKIPRIDKDDPVPLIMVNKYFVTP